MNCERNELLIRITSDKNGLAHQHVKFLKFSLFIKFSELPVSTYPNQKFHLTDPVNESSPFIRK